MDDLNNLRAEFEDWAKTPAHWRHGEGYTDLHTTIAWNAYQAGAARRQPDAAKQRGWVDSYGNVWPLGAYSPTGKPNYHDAHKRGWMPLYDAPASPVPASVRAAILEEAAQECEKRSEREAYGHAKAACALDAEAIRALKEVVPEQRCDSAEVRGGADAVDGERLSQIRSAIEGYYAALSARKDGDLAMIHAFNTIEQALGMAWDDYRAAESAAQGDRT